MNRYSKLIKQIVRFAYDIKQTVFTPTSDGSTIQMSVHNANVNDDVVFGYLRPEKSFIDFLRSGQYGPKTSGDITTYLRNGSFQLDQSPENQQALQTINENFDKAKKLGPDQILEYTRSKTANAVLSASFRKKPTGVPEHDATLDHYKIFLSGQKSQAPAAVPQGA